MQKITAMLEGLQHQQLAFVRFLGMAQNEPFLISPKISRGENYLGLPWLILDYPRTSQGGHLFFIRQMFWWGHFFSSTLHLSGRYREQHAGALAGSYTKLKDSYVSVNADPWAHHFEETNYQRVDSMEPAAFTRLIHQSPHTKLASRWSLDTWEELPSELLENWKFLLNCCGLIP